MHVLRPAIPNQVRRVQSDAFCIEDDWRKERGVTGLSKRAQSVIKAADWRRSVLQWERELGEDQREARTEAVAYILLIMTLSLLSANGFIACRIYSRGGGNQRSRVIIKH